MVEARHAQFHALLDEGQPLLGRHVPIAHAPHAGHDTRQREAVIGGADDGARGGKMGHDMLSVQEGGGLIIVPASPFGRGDAVTGLYKKKAARRPPKVRTSARPWISAFRDVLDKP